MANYFLIALIAPILWAIVSLIDKYVLSNFSNGQGVMVILIFSCLSSLIVLPIVGCFYHSEIFNITLSDFIIMLFVGLLTASAFYFYLEAMDKGEASMVIPYFQLIPVFGYLLGYFILDEVLSIMQALSCLIILIGILILSFEFDKQRKIIFKKEIIVPMIAASFLFSLHDALFKKVAISHTFWTTVFWQYLSIFLFGVLLLLFFKKARKDFKITMSEIKFKFLKLNILSEVLYILGNLAHNFATLLAPLVIVLVISSLQPLFVFIGGTLLTLFAPSVLNEKTSRNHIFHKSISISIIVIGNYLLYTQK